MPRHFQKNTYYDYPFPINWFRQDISTEGYTDRKGFAVRAEGAGTVTYTPLNAKESQTQSVSIGDYLGPDKNVPALVKEVEADLTVATVTILEYAT